MQAKSLQTFDRQIQRIQTQLAQLGPMRPGTLTRQYRQPERQQGGVLPAQLHLPDEESHRICLQTPGWDRSERDRRLPALQETHCPMDRSGAAALPVADAAGPVSPCPILPCQRGSQAESWAPNPQKLWKTPLRHPPLNQHSTASVNENARKLESSAFSASLYLGNCTNSSSGTVLGYCAL